MSWWWVLLAAAGLLAGNAFFVAVEFALLAARRSRVEQLAEESRFGAVTALRQMRSLNVQLAACQLGITVMSLLLGWLVEPSVGHLVEGWVASSPVPPAAATAVGVGLALLVVACFHMVLGEMVPKSVALTAPERVATTLAPIQRAVVLLTRPVVVVLDRLSRWGTRLLRIESTDELSEARSASELGVLLDESVAGGGLAPTEHLLLSGALGYLGGTVADHMVPVERVVTVDRGATVSEVEQVVHGSGHSRVVVVDRATGEVAGFVHAKGLLRIPEERRSRPLPATVVIPPVWAPADAPLTEVLADLRARRRHLAVVPVEPLAPGAVPRLGGLITLEDVVEAIVGDIRDESDRRTGRS